ncbi:MAG: hypothetical protein J6W70_03910, partial [Lentisphaeria bacterium]|nr:hypothetical protein [Lentisphaeria bacterium]
MDGERVSHVTKEHIRDRSAFGAMIKIARDGVGDVKGHITEEEADSQFESVAEIMNLIMTTQNPELVWEFAGSQLFSAVKSNSDGQYGTTVDFTTVCRKTVDMITAMSERMMSLGRGLKKSEVTALQKELIDAELQVPCPVCYVFSRWAGTGSLLDNMRRFQIKYADMSREEIRQAIEDLERRDKDAEKAEIRRRLREDPEAENYEAYTNLEGIIERAELENKELRIRLAVARDSAFEGDAAAIQRSIDANKDLIKDARKQMTDLETDMDTAAKELTWLQQVRSQDGYKPVPNDILFNMADADAVETFIKEYPASWKYRTTRGSAMGKAILPYADMRLGDLFMPLKQKSSDGDTTFANPLEIRGEFSDVQKDAIIKAIARTRAQNMIGGQRFQSTSDFRYDYALDYIQAFFEAQALGSNMQTYTKIIEFGEMVAKIGGDVNLSVMPRNKGYENWHLIFSDKTGINYGAALLLTEKYDNAQMILVGINDEHIRLALEDSAETGGIHIGFVIPYHASGAAIDTFIRDLVSN